MRGREACATAPRRSGRAGAGANAAAAGRGGAGRRDHRGDRPGASTRGRPARPGEGCSDPARAARPARSRRIDRVRLAACPAGAPLGHRQLRRHPHQIFAGAEQLPFQPAGQLAAVLNRPESVFGEPARPARAFRRCRPRSLFRRAVCRLRRQPPRSPTACVRADPMHHDHLHRLQAVGGDRASGQTSIEATRPRSYQVTLDRLGRRRHNAGRSTPRGDIRNRASRRRPSLRQQSDAATAARMTLSSRMTPDESSPSEPGATA